MTKKIIALALLVLLLVPGLSLASYYKYKAPTYGSDGSYKSEVTSSDGNTSAHYSRSASGVVKYTPESYSFKGPSSSYYKFKEPKQNSYNNNQYPAMKKYRY